MDAFAIHAGRRTDHRLRQPAAQLWHALAHSQRGQPAPGHDLAHDDGVTRNAWTATDRQRQPDRSPARRLRHRLVRLEPGRRLRRQRRAGLRQRAGDRRPDRGEDLPRRHVGSTRKTLNARFRVYPSVQTYERSMLAPLPDAAPQPTGGATAARWRTMPGPSAPLAVTLADFSAMQQGRPILVTWETTSELRQPRFQPVARHVAGRAGHGS